MKKITYSQALEQVLSSVPMTDEVREKLETLKSSLDKRSAAPKKPTKAQREIAEFVETVYAYVASQTEPSRCTDIAQSLGVSPQKTSAALSKLVKGGRVLKTEGEKKVSLFSLAE